MQATTVSDLPISVQFDFTTGIFAPATEVVDRRVSHLKEMFHDQVAVQDILAAGDRVVYEIRYHPFVTSTSDMSLGVTRIFPGKVGDEYHMTKGHFHERPDEPEIYFCVHGEGYLLMETRDGDFEAVPWQPGTIPTSPMCAIGWSTRAATCSSSWRAITLPPGTTMRPSSSAASPKSW